MKKWMITAMLAAVCLGLFVGCGNEEPAEVSQEQAQVQTEALTTETAQELAQTMEELTEEEYAQAQEQLQGTWTGSDGMTMWISFRKGICNVDIERVDGENSEYWHFSEYPGKKDDFILVAVDCSKYQITKDNGFAQELVYENGIAVITVTDGKITWQDGTEDAGAGIIFEKMAE